MIYAIGDVHGQCDKLVDLLARLGQEGMKECDTLVFVGDYVDRGPNVRGVIDLLIGLRQSRPNTVFLRGNHEQMMLDARQRFDPSFDSNNSCQNIESARYWFVEGSNETLRSYPASEDKRWFDRIPERHWEFILSTQMEYQEQGYTFVHAGLLPSGTEWEVGEFKADPRLWIRYEFIASQSDFGGQIVVFGHTPTKTGMPLILKNKVAIDTGAGHGGPLSAVGLPVPYLPDQVLVFQSR
jgi:serine/threonine protein phosphatase 1